jgi:hypothetical protein
MFRRIRTRRKGIKNGYGSANITYKKEPMIMPIIKIRTIEAISYFADNTFMYMNDSASAIPNIAKFKKKFPSKYLVAYPIKL